MSRDCRSELLHRYIAPKWTEKMRNVPRYYVKLAHGHTPIHPWPLQGVPEGFSVGIKRDDMTGSTLSGNKVRKLEFLLAEAIENGCNEVITCGSYYSNHCRTTAYATRLLGLKCNLLITAKAKGGDLNPKGNLLLTKLTGCNVMLTETRNITPECHQEMVQFANDTREKTGSPVSVIAAGGSSYTGLFGYFLCFQELIEQNVLEDYTDIVVTLGTGGTAAGLAIPNYLTGSKLKVHAVMICGNLQRHVPHVQQYLDVAGLNGIQAEDIIDFIDGQGLGYGQSTKEELDDVMRIASTTGVLLDTVYNVKSTRCMLSLMKNEPSRFKGKKILYVHTGGLYGLFEGTMESYLSSLNNNGID